MALSTSPERGGYARLSLLDERPIPAKRQVPESSAADQEESMANDQFSATTDNELKDATSMEGGNKYDQILAQAGHWKSELESVRDDLYILQMKNAVLLDHLTMAGADVWL